MTAILYIHIYLCFFIPVKYTFCYPQLHGRYSRDIDDYQLALPHKLTHQGNFLSFSLPHFFKHKEHSRRKRRSVNNAVNYGIVVDGKYHHLQLWPNHKLLSPHAFIEHRDPNVDLDKRKLKILKNTKVCHYNGKVKGITNSRVALSTCDGLAGYIMMNGQNFFIEPLEHHGANKKGHHMHIIHKRAVTHPSSDGKFCGTSDEWVHGWKERFTTERIKKQTPPTDSKKRAIKSLHRYMELLVVCDRYFMENYQHIDTQNYVLTIFNMVYDLYHDASVGNMIDISVVRIIYFEKEEDEIDIQITPKAVSTLANFCKWQQTINPKDMSSPIHHDVAVLISKYDLCDETKPEEGCILLGLAYVGTPCTTNEPCCINEENGLTVGFTITHEIGHIMGCSHDNYEVSGCNRQAPDNSYYVMSDTASANISEWSSCSKDFITTLLDNDLGECMNDEPDESSYKFAHMLPGIVYDSDMQCNYWMQSGSKLCPIANEEICDALMCTIVNTTNCIYSSKPAIAGTKCAENKWCFKTKCVDKGKRPDAIHGGWSEWNEWSDCSRTCGTGVSYKKRDCNNPVPEHGGRYCVGERKHMQLCNTQPCPVGSKEFRAVQCAEFDTKPIMGKLSKWEPFIQPDQRCVLFCINEKRQFAKLGPRVRDGTKCKLGTKDVCISGSCRKVGCDFKINSDAQEDHCGVCNGDGTACTVLGDEYLNYTGHGYVMVTDIPRGAVKAEISEYAPSVNNIAISDEHGKFCLNENNKEYNDGIYDCFNTSIVYTHPEKLKEHIFIRGPVLNTLFFYVRFYKPTENVGYHYHFADLTLPNTQYKPQYSWEHIEFSRCSYRCDSGIQTSDPSCVEAKMGKMSPNFCDDIEKPEPITRPCNEQPCKIKWRVGSWGPCKACKGAAGVRLREVECVREAKQESGDDTILEENKCKDQRPPARDYCFSKRACVKKRADKSFPEGMMKELFYQTIVDMFDVDRKLRNYFISQARTIRALRRHLKQYKRRRNGGSDFKQLCGSMEEDVTETTTEKRTTTTTTIGPTTRIIMSKDHKTKIEVGGTIMDDKHPQSLKMAVIHSGGIAPIVNLSEEAFQSVGNQLENTIVFDEKKNYTGKDAMQCLLNLHNVNGTSN